MLIIRSEDKIASYLGKKADRKIGNNLSHYIEEVQFG